MADQTVRIENLPNHKSSESVAYLLWSELRDKYYEPESVQQELALFEQCYNAARGRAFDASQFT